MGPRAPPGGVLGHLTGGVPGHLLEGSWDPWMGPQGTSWRGSWDPSGGSWDPSQRGPRTHPEGSQDPSRGSQGPSDGYRWPVGWGPGTHPEGPQDLPDSARRAHSGLFWPARPIHPNVARSFAVSSGNSQKTQHVSAQDAILEVSVKPVGQSSCLRSEWRHCRARVPSSQKPGRSGGQLSALWPPLFRNSDYESSGRKSLSWPPGIPGIQKPLFLVRKPLF